VSAAVVQFLEVAARTLPARLARWKSALAAAALARDVDPWLLAAVVDRETLGGEACHPRGAHGTGDNGNGLGLAQLDRRFHASFAAAEFLGQALWQDAAFNLLAAATLLRANLDRFGGCTMQAVAAYNASPARVRSAVAALPEGHSPVQRLAAVDSCTTGRDYVTDVLARRKKFLPSP
jgi:soluble lytic murein transglycosylase-like protein